MENSQIAEPPPSLPRLKQVRLESLPQSQPFRLVRHAIAAMVRDLTKSTDWSAPPTHFTLEQANRMLPLIRSIVAQRAQLQRRVEGQTWQLAGLRDLVEQSRSASHAEEVDEIRSSLEGDESRLDACTSELQRLGVRLCESGHGRIDFPSHRGRQGIVLCWGPEEERVGHWHGIDESGDQRRPIDSSIGPPC